MDRLAGSERVPHRFSTPDRRVGEALDNFLAAAAGTDDGALAGQIMFKDMLVHCQRASLAWPVRLTRMSNDEYRRGAVLAGPLFTSTCSPWPELDGLWLEPVLQVDLAVLGRLRGLMLGSGWLQVWMGPSGGTTRIVPEEEVELWPLAPVPSERAADYHGALAAPVEDTPGWLPGRAIIGFEAPFVDYGHNELLIYADWMIEEAPALTPAMLNASIAIRSAVDDDDDWMQATHRAFGMVSESELEAASLPPVLFVIEPDPPLITDSSLGTDALYVCYECGSGGQASVFSVHGRGS